MTAGVFAAETLTLTLTDGTSVTGDIVKSDDNGVMIHLTTETYTHKHPVVPFFAGCVETALQPIRKFKVMSSRLLNRPNRRARRRRKFKSKRSSNDDAPEHPSVFGGLVHSSVGLFILLVIYAANLYAAFEIAMVRGKPVGAVMGLSAVLPIAGPIFFLMQPIKDEPAPEEAAGEAAPGGTPPPQDRRRKFRLSPPRGSRSQEEKKPQPQVFARGKYTFNKRFIETKFAGFIGELKGDAKNFTMEVRTLKDNLPSNASCRWRRRRRFLKRQTVK